MKRIIIILYLWASLLQAQEHAWVYFKDKPDKTTYFKNPKLMLTQKALDRRSKQGIKIDEIDVPINTEYINEVATSVGIALKAKSKWLNAVHVYGFKNSIDNLLALSSVSFIEFADKNKRTDTPILTSSINRKFKTKKPSSLEVYDYGEAKNQTIMLGVDKLHDAGFDGKGLQIAVIDAGFSGVNTAEAFSHLLDGDIENGEVLGGYDFVNKRKNFYIPTGTTHGTQVLSTIAAIKEHEFVGTAPKSSFYLFITEDNNNETPLEESLWVQAAEKADSLGVDIINTSLGYNEFDESRYNYTYEDMDGETTFITRGATIAATKGMILVNSAGNSGNDTWNYLAAPADAKNTITVGAVNPNESIASFSSFGPSSDYRIKPETLAQGGSVYVVDENNIVKTSNGTSFSSPIIAGVTACLWQAFPNKTSLEIRQMVIENSEEFLRPTDQRGNGILKVAHLIDQLSFNQLNNIELPYYLTKNNNASVLQFFLNNNQVDVLKVELFSSIGRFLVSKQIDRNDNEIDLKNLSAGIYYLRITCLGVLNIQTLIIEN